MTTNRCGCEPSRPAPIACDFTVFDDAERAMHGARTRRLFGAVGRVDELADGYAFAFPAAPGLAEEVARWIEEERRCCPFLRFDVTTDRSGRGLRVQLTGPPGAKDVLRAGLADASAA